MAESVVQRLRRRELPRAAARRAVRAAILVPGTFAISYLLLHDPTAALFSAVGSVTLLLYVDFGGPIWPRIQSQANLILITLVLLCIGSLAAQSLWIAVPATLIVTFVILFSGIVSSVLAGAQTSMLVSFLLPLTLLGSIDSIPHRILGWLIASAGSLIAVTLVWPGPTNEPLRQATNRACRALGMHATALAARFGASTGNANAGADTRADSDAGADAAHAAVADLRKAFLGTPYRPSGLGTAARELAKTIDQLFLLSAALRDLKGASTGPVPEIEALLGTTGAVLADCADVLEVSRADTTGLLRRRGDLAGERERMQSVTVGTDSVRARPGNANLVSALRPSFAAQQVAGITDTIIAHTLTGASARARTWLGHVLGIRPAGVAPALATARNRAGAHFDWSSVWLRNSTRGAIGFTLTVLVANISDVEHAFWVAFGTLAVLRSSASATGQNALRALAGTFIGIVVGGVFVTLVGSDTTLCWILLPIAVGFTGIAPAVSFTAGQAGFSVTLILLFDLISPTGWTIGIVRIEDVAIGCAVSVVVGLLLWPRGAASRFGAALADALSESAHYLGAATDYALMQCSAGIHTATRPDIQQRGASDAARRLDDSFRQFIAERGAKHLSLADVGTLVLGVAELRRSADGICALWQDAGAGIDLGSNARTEVLLAGGSTVEWYDDLAAALTGASPPPETTSAFRRAGDRVEHDIEQAERNMDAAEAATAIRMIWTLDYLDSVRELEATVLPIATHAAEASASRAAWFAGVRRRRAPVPVVE
ncbi:MAG TPA: FUSC family protein [Galbitalea sp.]|jgi:uncharacterized membrane protein YccC